MVGKTVETTTDGILPAVAQLAGSQDPEAALLGLSIFDLVLKQLPAVGAKMIESVDGISILEEQQMRSQFLCSNLQLNWVFFASGR